MGPVAPVTTPKLRCREKLTTSVTIFTTISDSSKPIAFSTKVPSTNSQGRFSRSRRTSKSFSVAVPGVGWSRTRLPGMFPSRFNKSAMVRSDANGEGDETLVALGGCFGGGQWTWSVALQLRADSVVPADEAIEARLYDTDRELSCQGSRIGHTDRCSVIPRWLSCSFWHRLFFFEHDHEASGQDSAGDGARGIGRGCAMELARAGPMSPSTTARRPLRPRRSSLRFRAWPAPGAGRRRCLSAASCESIVQRAIDGLGRIDILVSNPAYSRRADFLDYDPETFTKVIEGTLIAGFHMGQLVARYMVERGGGGKMVFISSGHAHIPYARSIAYNAAKGGLNQLAFTIATELYPHRINVNVIEPGWIDTPGEHEAFGDEVMAGAAAALPWGRFGTVEDIGKAAVFLASDDADYITGAALRVDGGIWLQNAHE